MKKSIFEMLQCCSVAVLRGVGKKTIFCLIFLNVSEGQKRTPAANPTHPLTTAFPSVWNIE